MDREAMSLGQLISTLERVRATCGGDLPVKMADGEPVVRAEWVLGAGDRPTHVVISDL
jgi:hypothetical protein